VIHYFWGDEPSAAPTNVVGIFPNGASITRLVGAMMLELNDEWSLNRRDMQLEVFGERVVLTS